MKELKMKKKYWIHKLNIDSDADVLFYQNPKFFRTNSFKKERLEKSADALIKLAGKIDMYLITGVANSHHKNDGKRLKICLVKKYLK